MIQKPNRAKMLLKSGGLIMKGTDIECFSYVSDLDPGVSLGIALIRAILHRHRTGTSKHRYRRLLESSKRPFKYVIYSFELLSAKLRFGRIVV